MTDLRRTMLEELLRRNMSAITTRIYLHAVEEFAHHFNTPPDRLGLEHVRKYQAHLFTDRKLEAVSVAQQLSSLRFFFLKTLKRLGCCRTCPRRSNRSGCPRSRHVKRWSSLYNARTADCIASAF